MHLNSFQLYRLALNAPRSQSTCGLGTPSGGRFLLALTEECPTAGALVFSGVVPFISQLKNECRISRRSGSLWRMFQYAITQASATFSKTNASAARKPAACHSFSIMQGGCRAFSVEKMRAPPPRRWPIEPDVTAARGKPASCRPTPCPATKSRAASSSESLLLGAKPPRYNTK